MRTLDSMAERARRQLDGMTINRDEMAKDVLALVELVRRFQQLNAESSDKKGKNSPIWKDLFGL